MAQNFLNIDMDKQRFLYKKIFIIYTLFFTTEFSEMKSFNVIKAILMVWGVAVLGMEVYRTKGRHIFKDLALLIFTISGAITMLANYNIKGDFKLYLITVIQIFVLNSFDARMSTENLKKEIRKMDFLIIICTFILTAVGLIMYYVNPEGLSFTVMDAALGNKFKGLYILSNVAGMVAYVSIIISTMKAVLNSRNEFSKKFNIYCYINIAVQGYALIISGSRAALASVIAFYVIFAFMMIPKRNERIAAAIVAVIIAVGGAFYIKSNPSLSKSQDYGFLSGREILWKNGYESAFRARPIIGVGPANTAQIMLNKATEDLPGVEGGRVHNIYLDVMYSNGVLGIIGFMLFIIGAMGVIYKKSFYEDLSHEDRMYVKILFAILASLLIMNLVESILVYVISLVSTVFWIYMGYAQYFIKRYR